MSQICKPKVNYDQEMKAGRKKAKRSQFFVWNHTNIIRIFRSCRQFLYVCSPNLCIMDSLIFLPFVLFFFNFLLFGKLRDAEMCQVPVELFFKDFSEGLASMVYVFSAFIFRTHSNEHCTVTIFISSFLPAVF